MKPIDDFARQNHAKRIAELPNLELNQLAPPSSYYYCNNTTLERQGTVAAKIFPFESMHCQPQCAVLHRPDTPWRLPPQSLMQHGFRAGNVSCVMCDPPAGAGRSPGAIRLEDGHRNP